MPVTRHYLLAATPLMFLWLGRQALPDGSAPSTLRVGRALLFSLCLILGLISVTFLGYIHTNQRPIAGDYGTPYGAQRQLAGPHAGR
jgi:hypothetical protein